MLITHAWFIVALYGVLFKNNSTAAFSTYKLWQSLGATMAFGYQSSLCFPIKVYIMLMIFGLSIAGYGTVEFFQWTKRRNKNKVSSEVTK